MTVLDYFVENPGRTVRWHPEKNGDLLPSEVLSGSRKRVWWQCDREHAWQAAVYAVTGLDSGCPYCSGKLAIPGRTDLATTHPHILRLWHEGNALSPRQVSAGSHRRVWWRCDQGHEWEAMIGSVAVDGCGCPYCAGKRAIPGVTDLATLCPEIVKQWDWARNGDLTPDRVLPSGHDRVWWNCDRGHHWQAVVFSRTKEQGSGCPYCTGRKVLAGFNDLETLKPKLAKEWHPVLNRGLTPRDVTLGSNKKVWWQCADGHVWQAAVYSRTRKKGTGCPVCAGMVKKTKPSPRGE